MVQLKTSAAASAASTPAGTRARWSAPERVSEHGSDDARRVMSMRADPLSQQGDS